MYNKPMSSEGSMQPQWVAIGLVVLSMVLSLAWRRWSLLLLRRAAGMRPMIGARYSVRRQPCHKGPARSLDCAQGSRMGVEVPTVVGREERAAATSPMPPAAAPDEAPQPQITTPCDAVLKCAASFCTWKDEDASVHHGDAISTGEADVHDLPAAVDDSCRGEAFANALAELREVWLRDIRPKFEPAILRDPLLSPENLDVALARYLDAEGGRVQQAARRLEATAIFRREYRCVDFYQRGMARRLLMHASNGGACVYFGDMGLRALDGTPVLVGRVSLMVDTKHTKPSDAMLPAQHLRAAMFVIERSAAALPARVGSKGAYILDVGGYPVAEMAAHNPARTRYWDADGEGDVRKPAAVLPHLPGHSSLAGLGVLKEAMRICERHYPETLHKVFFYRPGPAFRVIFAIFRMWVPKTTRDRFVLVRPGDEPRHFFRPPPHGAGLRPEDTPREFGGRGPSLEGDLFLRRACDRYDATATGG